MLLNTLTFYLIGATLSFVLVLVMLIFARLQPGTLITRSYAIALAMFAVAFLGSGLGPEIPRWMTVIGTNMLFVAALVMLHTGFAAYCSGREPTLDWFGWGIVAATALPFWYWGLVEPNGYYRSAVYSLASFLVVVRTARLSFRAARRERGKRALWVIAAIFIIGSLWMAGRFVLSISADVPTLDQRGTNPTTWVTVFWFIVMISVTAIAVMWLDASRKNDGDSVADTNSVGWSGPTSLFRKRLLLLWGGTFILVFAVISELGIAYSTFLEDERERLTNAAKLANEAFVEQTSHVLREADTLIRAVRSHYLLTHSLTDTGRFISSLKIDKTFIEDIFIIDADGMIMLPESARAMRRDASTRDYFVFHRDHSVDEVFITPVSRGQITGKNQFRVTRRISNPDGSFAGVVVIPLEPRAFTNYYRSFLTGSENIAVLIGTDRRLRARVPEADDDAWQRQIDSPLWAALEQAGIGAYRNRSSVDGTERTFLYRHIPDLPLVVVTGFSDGDANRGTLSKLRVFIPAGLFAVVFILALAGILTVVLRQRDEQDRFMSMLSHELKTPLSVIHMTLGGLTIPPDVRARVGRAVGAMTAVIERCLQADRLRHGRVVAARDDCRISDVLAAICKGSSVPERCHLQADTLPTCITDIQLLTVIVTNLIDNALKYSAPDSQIDVAAMSAQERQRPGVRIVVSNLPGASGMPDARHVFRKYYRSAGARSKTGSGLGLHIAEGFARKLGGRLRYQPAAGKVKFTLWVPL